MTDSPAFPHGSTRALLLRLWRDHLRAHRPRMVLVLVLTGIMSASGSNDSLRRCGKITTVSDVVARKV